jgi:hypothetical protein
VRQIVDDRLKAIADQVSAIPSLWKVAGVALTAALGTGSVIVGLLVGVLAYGSDRFNGGTQFALDAVGKYGEMLAAERESAERTQRHLDDLREQIQLLSKEVSEISSDIRRKGAPT